MATITAKDNTYKGRFIYSLNALWINTTLSNLGLSGRFIHRLDPHATNSRTFSTHMEALDLTRHTVTVPHKGVYEICLGMSCNVNTRLKEVAVSVNWVMQDHGATTPPRENRLLYINSPATSSIGGVPRPLYRSVIAPLEAGDELQIVEIGVADTSAENFCFTIKEL